MAQQKRLSELWEKCGRVYINQKVFNRCYPEIKGWIDVNELLIRMRSHGVATIDQSDKITNQSLSPDDRKNHLLDHINKCGKHGFFWLYVCFFESSENHIGHRDVCEELKKTAIEMGVKAPWDMGLPVTTRAEPEEDHLRFNQGESVEKDQAHTLAAAHPPAQIQNQGEPRTFIGVVPGSRETVAFQSVDDDGRSKVDARLLPYDLSKSKSRGLALIINNHEFPRESNLTNRICGPTDGVGLKSTFKECGYRIRYEENKTANEIHEIFGSLLPLKTAQEGFSLPDSVVHESDDSFVCCVVSHGTWDEGRRQDLVYGSDGRSVSVQQLAFDFLHVPSDSDRQNLLKKKPKLFFVHACRGKRLTPVVADGDKSDKKSSRNNVYPILADFLFAYPVVPETMAFRDDTGTFFIRCLCDAIKDLKKKLGVELMLKRVHYDLTTDPAHAYEYEDGEDTVIVRHCPQVISTLRGPFFFTKDAEKKYIKHIK